MWILTLGLYMFYWYYSTLEEMTKFQGERTDSLLWTIGMFIPIVNLFSMWKHASTVDRLTDGKYPAFLLWLLWIFLSPALWILVQTELNSMADTPPPATVA